MERIETVIVGGGQAGLATSYFLQYGRQHIVLERAAQAANAWRNGRWDSFTLVTSNWTLRMPGAEYNGEGRDGFMPRDEIVRYFEQYVEQFQLSVRYSTDVLSVEPIDSTGYRVQTAKGVLKTNNVVIATGLEQLPKLPTFVSDISPEIAQLHSSAYRNPGLLPAGAVLVVGSAQSGCQITEELYQSGRRVYLCTGSAGRALRHYRGKDTVEWLYQIGFFNITPDKLPISLEHFAAPHLSGKDGGHNLNLHQFARDGVILLGHLRGIVDSTIFLAPDLQENLAKADEFERNIVRMVDDYITANLLDVFEEELLPLHDGYQQPIIEELDLKAEGISTIIWATGYTFDFGLVKLPVLNEAGFPLQTHGVTNHTGLYFVGMPWMPSLKSGTLAGVGESAQHIASKIAHRE